MAEPHSSDSDASSGGTPAGRPPVDPSGAAVPPPPPPGYAPPAAAPEPSGRRGGIMSRLLGSTVLGLLVFSIVLNVYMGVLVYRMGAGPTEALYQRGVSDERIVILPFEGLIREGTYDFARRALRQLRDDPPAAIVLRIESPGGGVGASDRILGEIKRFRSRMEREGLSVPIVASFGSFATSGGYYVAMAADQILAEPTSTTGSIGVIAQAFTLEDLMDKIGVTPEIIVSTGSTQKDMLNTFRHWEDDDRAKLRQVLDNNYEQFVEVVYTGRQNVLSRDEVRDLATGEIFTADVAREKRLIDGVGYLADAIAAAAEAADIDVEPRVTLMRPSGGMGLLGLIAGRASEARAERSESMSLADAVDLARLSPRQVRDWLLEASMPRVMYLAPIHE